MPSNARNKVVILGGGIAGLSAAHELVERGFEVDVFERNAVPGGKARSLDAHRPTGLVLVSEQAKRSAGGARPPLPGEHGFRFFPGFYRHVVDTMARIPYRGGSVANNLVATSELSIASYDRPPFILPVEYPQDARDSKTGLFAAITAISGRAGVAPEDALFFSTRLWQFLSSCEERRLGELEHVAWWDFVEAGSRSSAYQKFFGDGITRSLVAAKARLASTKTIGNIFLQILFDVLTPGVTADRLLNGPTNDVWIGPWLAYLQARGVNYHFASEVRSLECFGGAIRSATIAVGDRVREVSGDYFIGALPVERMTDLLSASLIEGDPSLANLHALASSVEWMNGIQYYLTERLPVADGHVIYVDSPWALTSVSQAQFWNDFALANYGDGTVREVLSVDVSDWNALASNGKAARQCSREEVARETWRQLKKSLNVGREVLRDDQLHSWFLDPGIQDSTAPASQRQSRLSNAEPLLVNYVDTWRLRPEAVTRIGNFFLASDYVRTFTDLATMEAANEAARRAVNGLLRAAHSDAEPCALWNLREPQVFEPIRARDRVRYRRGLPWDATAVDTVRPLLELGNAAPPTPPTTPSLSPVLDLFAKVEVELPSATVFGATPDGARIAFYVAGGTWRGPRIVARYLPEGGDWMLVRKDGVALPNVRATLETEDGALLYYELTGTIDLGPDGYARTLANDLPDEAPFSACGRVSTSSERWQWLNRLTLVGAGVVFLKQRRANYDLYSLLARQPVLDPDAPM